MRKKSKLPIVDLIFANKKNTLIFAAILIGVSFYLVESVGTFTWSQMIWVFVVITLILFISGKKELEEIHSELNQDQASERLFGIGGHLEKEQKLGRLPAGAIKPMGDCSPYKIDSKVIEYTFGYEILDQQGIGEEWAATINTKTGSCDENEPRPGGLTNKSKRRFRLHPESVLERKRYLEELGKNKS